MDDASRYFFLHGAGASLLLDAPVGASPRVAYLGPRLRDGADGARVDRLRARQGAPGSPLVEPPVTLAGEPGVGFMGPVGFAAHRDGRCWAPTLKTVAVRDDASRIEVECADDANGVRAIHRFEIGRGDDVIRIDTTYENAGATTLIVERAPAACLQAPPELTEVLSFSGRWAGEFQTERAPLRQGGFVVENRRGRTSHDRFPGFILCTNETRENAGACLGVHLGWSGNHQLRVDALADGRVVLQAAEWFSPGEIRLAPAATYDAPPLYLRYAADGLTAMSRGFHDYYRNRLADARLAGRPRPIHYNTWEGIYFDHNAATLDKLVDAAADLGVERFVLDDGWFKGRRHERAGLGDWTVDADVYPNGLGPLIARVNAKGMAFGLWVEPEMTNADSDLFREHPDWILAAPPAADTPSRHQFVLDLTRPEAFERIFNQLDALLTENPGISYLKWDMNRDLNHPGGADGAPATHAQTRAVYALIDRIRAKWPALEIESCSSGGARIDYGVLERTDRVWTSDSNDALDRQLIQRGASYFLPLSVLGAHVGPRDCHITGRVLSIGLRAGTALFGHMGVEADLLAMSATDRAELKEAFALYKKHRELIHGGDFVRLEGPAWRNAVGVVAKDRRAALFSYALTGSTPTVTPDVLRFDGLDPDTEYKIRLIWPTRIATPPPHWLENSELVADGYDADGAMLMHVGLQVPLLRPQTCLVFDVAAA